MRAVHILGRKYRHIIILLPNINLLAKYISVIEQSVYVILYKYPGITFYFKETKNEISCMKPAIMTYYINLCSNKTESIGRQVVYYLSCLLSNLFIKQMMA